jgi:hypothetical protein
VWFRIARKPKEPTKSALLAEASAWRVRCPVGASKAAITPPARWRPAASVPTATTVMPVMPTTAVTAACGHRESVKNTHESFSFRKHVKATWGSGWLHHYFSKRVDMIKFKNKVSRRGRLRKRNLWSLRFCNTDFDDKLACLNLSGV